MKRSPEIQGLRAVAVLLVLLFHADWLPGGFVGVDIFYVISGYLITQLILREIFETNLKNNSAFSFKRFYARRAKRLLPAAFLVLFVTALAFWLLAPATQRPQFGRDLLASTWYISNYLFAFWQNDYQNLGSVPSPLIHFWSLAVEEQFYLCWPLILFLGRKRLKIVIPAITMASFVLSLIWIQTKPILAFYSLPTRAFELGLGAMVALFTLRTKATRAGLYLGLGSLLFAALWFDKSTPFPGWAALLPTLGTVLVLSSLRDNRLLASKAMQRIGDWSYSIYLWHWPILVIPASYFQRELTNLERLLLLLLCICISGLTYKLVEHPFRTKEIPPIKVITGALLGAVLLTLISILFINQSSQALEFNGKQVDLASVREKPRMYGDGCQLDKLETKVKDCRYGSIGSKRKVVLFGDSHAAQWFPAVEIWAKEKGFELIVITKSSCPAYPLPLRDNGAFKAAPCNEFRENAIAQIKMMQPDILVVSNYEHYSGLSVTDYLKAEQSFPLPHLLIRDTPLPNRDIPDCLLKKGLNTRHCQIQLPQVIPYKNQTIFDPTPALCNFNNCPAMVDGLIAYRDQNHISVAIAGKLAKSLGAKLDSLVAG